MLHSFLGFKSLKAELIFIGVLLVILVVVLLCEYRQKRLLKKYMDMKDNQDKSAA